MKQLLILLLVAQSICTRAQTNTGLHHGEFKKRKLMMSSNPYKPDDWEKPFFDSSITTAFPSDLIKAPEKYTGKRIHLIGIVDSVLIDSNQHALILLNNKYWDYTEDHSIQDEIMFVSEKGDGKFWVNITGNNTEQLEMIKQFPAKKTLLLVYGTFKEVADNYPLLEAQQVKYIDYELYTTRVFYYDVLRDKNGAVATDKKGKIQLTDFRFLKVAAKGQNK